MDRQIVILDPDTVVRLVERLTEAEHAELEKHVKGAVDRMEFVTLASAWLMKRFPDDWNAGRLRYPRKAS